MALIHENSEAQERHAALCAAALLSLLAVTWYIYVPAISGFFLLDDFDNLSALKAGVTDLPSLAHFLSIGNAGPLGRPLSKLTFLIDDNAWPSDPAAFKRTNIFLHMLCVVIAFAALRRLLSTVWTHRAACNAALAVAALWALHPLNMSTVAYVVQRMTILATLFILSGILAHVAIRQSERISVRWQLALASASMAFFTGLAAYSKETGVLLPVYILALEATVLRSSDNDRAVQWWRRTFTVAPTALLIGYLLYLPHWAASYGARSFTLWERLLTQPVVLTDYLWKIASFRIYGLGVFHDDFPVYSSPLNPSVVVSITLLACALASALVLRRHAPVISLGIMWFLVGHLLESTTVSLEIYFEHRNYLPMIGALLAAAGIIHAASTQLPTNFMRYGALFFGGFICIVAGKTYGLANEWGAQERIIPIWAAEHPTSKRAQRTYAHYLAGRGLAEAAIQTVEDAYKLAPTDLSLPVMSIDIACRFGARSRFDLPTLATLAGKHEWTNALRPAMQSLLTGLPNGHCSDQLGDAHALVRAIPDIRRGELRRSGIASIFTLDGDLYLSQGNGNGALDAYKTAHALSPQVGTALRISDLLIRVRQYDAALEWLEEAKRWDIELRGPFKTRRLTEYEKKAQMIRTLGQGLSVKTRPHNWDMH